MYAVKRFVAAGPRSANFAVLCRHASPASVVAARPCGRRTLSAKVQFEDPLGADDKPRKKRKRVEPVVLEEIPVIPEPTTASPFAPPEDPAPGGGGGKKPDSEDEDKPPEMTLNSKVDTSSAEEADPIRKENLAVWDETFAKVATYMDKPGAIRKLMSLWQGSMFFTGSVLAVSLYFFPIPYLCSPELVMATALTKITTPVMYSSIEWRAKALQKRHPHLKKLMFSRKLPDPDLQDPEAIHQALKDEYGMFTKTDTSKLESQLEFRRSQLVGQKTYGLAWDIADNARTLSMIPGFTLGFVMGNFSQGLFEWGLYEPTLFGVLMPVCASMTIMRCFSPMYFKASLNGLDSYLDKDKKYKDMKKKSDSSASTFK